MIKYLGSKRTLLPAIESAIDALPIQPRTILDLFSGTSRVGHALKSSGFRVLANDHNAYAATLARCYVAADREDALHSAEQLVEEFNTLARRDDLAEGYFTRTFCHDSRFFQPKNGRRIDVIRNAIAAKHLPPELEAVILVSLMEAADRVDSTTGVQMAYLKQWAPRSYNDLCLRVPNLLPRSPHGKGEAHQLDAFDAAQKLHADVAYIDPPYNQHSYLGNYHVWETLIRLDQPEAYGVARKRVDVRQRQSVFNSRPKFLGALRTLLHSVRADTIILSFSDEGYISREDLLSILAELFDHDASITTLDHDYKRYVGAQIGIHNPQGEKVGTVSHLRNTESLYVVTRRRMAAVSTTHAVPASLV